MNITKNAFYIIKNEFFDKVQDSSLPFLKNGRPSFYCIEDKNNKNILWVIPMTTKIEKVNKIIEKQGFLYTFFSIIRLSQTFSII